MNRLLLPLLAFLCVSFFCGKNALAQSDNITGLDILPTQLIPNSICEGEEFKVRLSVFGGTLNASSKFTIRLFALSPGGVEPPYVDIPATLTAPNELTARYPRHQRLSRYVERFWVGIIMQNPNLTVTNNRLRMQVYPVADFTLTASKQEISVGEEVYISAEPTGRPPFAFTFTNNQPFPSEANGYPVKTTTYTVKTFESGCGVVENPVHTPVTVQVKPSLFIAPMFPSNVRTFCEGQTVRIPFKANGVTAQTTYTVEAFTFAGDKFTFPAKPVGDSLELTIPRDTGRDPKLNYGRIWQARLVSANPALVSPKTAFKVQTVPFITLSPNSEQSVPFPSAIHMIYTLSGGSPYVLEFADGTKRIEDSDGNWLDQYIKKDTVFKAKALSNACFRNDNPASLPLRVEKPSDTTPSLHIEHVFGDFCQGDSVSVNVYFNGQFGAGNIFTVQVGPEGAKGAYKFQVTKPGRYKVKLPIGETRPFLGIVGLSSTQPVLNANTGNFKVEVPPTFMELQLSGTEHLPDQISNGFAKHSTLAHSTPRTTLSYNFAGTEGKIMTDSQGDARVEFPMPPNKLMEFRLLSAENRCGTYSVAKSAFAYMKEYDINVDPWDRDQTFCPGTQMYLPIFFQQGTPPKNTRFTLEIKDRAGDGAFKELATAVDENHFLFTIPNKTAEEYEMRVVSSSGVVSNPFWMRIGEVPLATVGLKSGDTADTTVTIRYGSDMGIATALTGHAPWRIIYSDGQATTTDDRTHYRAIKIEQPAVYTIAKVWNSCGFGRAQGSIAVKVKPALKLTAVPAGGTAELCPGQSLDLSWTMGGVTSLSGYYLVFSYLDAAGREIRLDSTQQITGKMLLKLPSSLPGIELLRVRASIPALEVKEEMQFALSQSPDFTIFGDNTIWSGQSAKIFVRSNIYSGRNVSFTLSDGSSHSFLNTQRGAVTEIVKQPEVTTTYTLKTAAASCGTAKLSGTAVVTVEKRKSGWLTVSSASAQWKSGICNRDTILVYFTKNGTVSGNATYTVQLSDSLGRNFTALKTTGMASPLKAVIPDGVAPNSSYRLRLTTNDSDVSAATLSALVRIGRYARAKVLTPALTYQEGQVVQALVDLQGSAPYQYFYRAEGKESYKTASVSPDTLRLTPTAPSTDYKITAVANFCGSGTVDEPSEIHVGLITGTESPATTGVLRFGPNPAQGDVEIWFADRSERTVSTYNASGLLATRRKIRADHYTLPLANQPAGIYLVEINSNGRLASYRVVKY